MVPLLRDTALGVCNSRTLLPTSMDLLSMQKICNLITHLFDLMVAVCLVYLYEVCGSDSLLPRLLLSLGCLLKYLNPSVSSHEGLHQ